MIVASPHVYVIASYQFTSEPATLNKLWLKTWSEKRKKQVAIHEAVEEYGGSVLKVLAAFHAISRCDSVSSFCDTGWTALSTLKDNTNDLMEFIKFEDSITVDLQDDCLEAVIWFVCFLYDK